MIKISASSFFRFCWKNEKLDWPKCVGTILPAGHSTQSRRLSFTKVPSGHGSNFVTPRVAFAKPTRLNESSTAAKSQDE